MGSKKRARRHTRISTEFSSASVTSSCNYHEDRNTKHSAIAGLTSFRFETCTRRTTTCYSFLDGSSNACPSGWRTFGRSRRGSCRRGCLGVWADARMSNAWCRRGPERRWSSMGRISEWTVPDGAPSRAVRDLMSRALCSLRTRSVRLGAETGHPTRSRGSFHPRGGGNTAPPLCRSSLAVHEALARPITLSLSRDRHLFSLHSVHFLSCALPSLASVQVTRARTRLVCILVRVP